MNVKNQNKSTKTNKNDKQNPKSEQISNKLHSSETLTWSDILATADRYY